MPHCLSLTKYSRFKTREVAIGNKIIGGDQAILLQSMTTADTMDTEETILQSIRMIEAGCELVRITAPSKKEAENLRLIRKLLDEKGYHTPLVADIHFTPNAAELAAQYVEKVRINPGNYADKKKFENITYTEESYQSELHRIEERFTPLVLLCKKNDIAMRIGTNHGSLSDRILSRYGDTPMGMVESAFEFLRICIKNDYHKLVLSMKASNTVVMVQAYRLLVKRMIDEGFDYPIHLGVTEAGDGEDGRIKSAVGIGALLEDGIGDTVRVSLTEEPEYEIPVARTLVERYIGREQHAPIKPVETTPIDFFQFQRRNSSSFHNIGDHQVPVVIASLEQDIIQASSLFPFGYKYSVPLDKWNINDQAADYIYIGSSTIEFDFPGTLGIIQDFSKWEKDPLKERHYPLLSKSDLFVQDLNLEQLPLIFIQVDAKSIIEEVQLQEQLSLLNNAVLILSTDNIHGMAEQRRSVIEIINLNIHLPIIFKRDYRNLDSETFQIHAASDLGALFVDGLGDGIWLEAQDCGGRQLITSTAFGILQACRARISKTEYISCPSCGRTLFDLQETTAKIRAVTSHLKGIKIGIMGCIVNGPGEMADADYGYVGTGPGKITLYKEKEVVKRNVPEDEAVEALVQLIDEHGDWIEKK